MRDTWCSCLFPANGVNFGEGREGNKQCRGGQGSEMGLGLKLGRLV